MSKKIAHDRSENSSKEKEIVKQYHHMTVFRNKTIAYRQRKDYCIGHAKEV